MADIRSILIEEIALEGLDGITIESLWIRLKNAKFPLNLDDLNSREYVWKNLILKFSTDNFKFYELPVERPPVVIYNRYNFVSEETGYCIHNEDNIPDDCYAAICPVSKDHERGSCNYYKERKLIKFNELNKSLKEVILKYGDKLVIVADQRLRNQALRINHSDPLLELHLMQYCILERVGRCRKLGEVTFGKESAKFKESPKTLFYYRKLLLNKGLLTKQTHTVYNSKSQSITRGLLLMLPRFHMERKSAVELGATKLIEILKSEPNFRANYQTVKERTKIRAKAFKLIFTEFNKNVKLIEEDTIENKKLVKTKYVQLIKALDEDESDDELDDLEDDDKLPIKSGGKNRVDYFSPKSILINRPLLNQSFNVVESFNIMKGISLREFQSELTIPRLDARMLIRMLEKLDEATVITTNNGRQKMQRYFLKNNINDEVTRFNSENNLLDLGKKATLRQLQRANIILKAVEKHQIIDQLIFFKKIILEAEKNLSYTVDQKSIKTILELLVKEKHLNWFTRTIEKGSYSRTYNLVCVPSITEDHDIVKERFEQAKFKYGTSSHELELNDEDKEQQINDWSLNANSLLLNCDSADTLIYSPSVGRKYGLEPKMRKIITFYKFLFFTLSDQCTKDNDFDDWRKFITPLPKSYEKNTCQLGDLIPRMPISIFVRVVFITFVIPGLDEILNDPVRCNYTLQMLPPEMTKNLFRKRKYIFCMVELLTMLAYLNLVKVEAKHLSMKESVVVKLLKTTQFTEDDYTKNYRFENLNDVELFENDLALHSSRNDCKSCSFDSRLYIHNPRNWSYLPKVHFNQQMRELKRFSRLKNIINSEAYQTDDYNIEINPAFKPIPSKNVYQTKRKAASVSKRVKRKKTTHNNENQSNNNQTTNSIASLKSKGYDKSDINALSLLRKQRCEWSKEEDSFLLMCRVSSVLLHPSNIHFVCVSRGIIRDELHKYLPHISADKTSKACQRRLMYMLKNPSTRANVLDWVAECKQDEELASIKKPNVPITHEEEWNKQFISILYKLLKKFQNENFIIRPSNPVHNFKSLNEIYKDYNLIESEIHCMPQKPVLYFQPNNVVDVYVNVVLNVLSSSLLSNLFEYSEEYNTKATITLFKIYQRYPDTMIRAVVNKMKQNGMMANLKSSERTKIKNKNKKLALFKISYHYCYILKSKYSIDTLMVPLEPGQEIKFEEFKSSDIAILANLISMNQARLTINLPDNFVSFKDNFNNKNSQNQDKLVDENEPSTSDQMDTTTDPFSSCKRASRFVLCSLRQKLSSNLTENVQRMPDYLKLNGCEITSDLVRIDSDQTKLNAFLELLNKQEAFVQADGSYLNELDLGSLDRMIVKEIAKTKELGLNFDQLKNSLSEKSVDDEELKKKLEKLCDVQAIFEVGVEEVRYVTHKSIFPWLVHAQIPFTENIRLKEAIIVEDQSTDSLDENKSSCSTDKPMDVDSNNNENQNANKTNSNRTINQIRQNIYKVNVTDSFIKPNRKPIVVYFVPKFWKTPFGRLDKRVILMFLGGILGHVMANPGITKDSLIKYFKSCLPPVQTLEIVNLLVKGGCLDRFEQTVESTYTLFGEATKKQLVYYETSRDFFINIGIIKKVLEDSNWDQNENVTN